MTNRHYYESTVEYYLQEMIDALSEGWFSNGEDPDERIFVAKYLDRLGSVSEEWMNRTEGD